MPQGHVLVVDDEESMRTTLAANLELEGFTVVEAENGGQALEKVAAESFDLMLTDIRMPGINGVDLFRRVKELKPDMPVVLMTAFALENLVDSALNEGAFTVLPKPFDVAHVVRTLDRAVRLPVVLVIDDQRTDAESTAAALNAAGLKARAVFGGEAALDAVRDGTIDVCVVDLVMPGMSGPEVVERLRSAVNPSPTVIAISGYAVPELLQKAAAFQIFTCLRKPFAPTELVNAIGRARGQPSPRR